MYLCSKKSNYSSSGSKKGSPSAEGGGGGGGGDPETAVGSGGDEGGAPAAAGAAAAEGGDEGGAKEKSKENTMKRVFPQKIYVFLSLGGFIFDLLDRGPTPPPEIDMRMPANHLDLGTILPSLEQLEELRLCYQVKIFGFTENENIVFILFERFAAAASTSGGTCLA